jgi:hypothetical protein
MGGEGRGREGGRERERESEREREREREKGRREKERKAVVREKGDVILFAEQDRFCSCTYMGVGV